jgi:endoglucanase
MSKRLLNGSIVNLRVFRKELTMMKRNYLWAVGLIIALFVAGCNGGGSNNPHQDGSGGLADNGQIPKEFIRRQGNQLVVGENDLPIRLEGVCFGNEVWGNPATPSATHHNEADYQRVQDMHMNVIRFYLNYGMFESDSSPYHYKQSGWDWLDRNIGWAKSHNIYLILNMHYPQGGFQSNGDGMALWDVPENQNRLTALWKAIAARYQNEPAIAGYDLVNEPVVSKSLSQWQALANRLMSSIRTVDRHHLIIVERTNGVKGDWTTYNGLNFFVVNDSNLIYTFHCYSPIEYSHQNASWTGLPEDGGYPDPNILMVPADATWYKTTFNNPVVSSGNSAWQLYAGEMYHADDPKLLTGKPAFQAQKNTGTVYFDDFVIKEYDENKQFLRDIYTVNVASMDGSSWWSSNGSGSCTLSTTVGHGDNLSIQIAGTKGDANLGFNKYRFQVTQGHYYQINGYMKGTGVSAGSTCRFRIDFETSPSGAQVYPRNKEYLESVITRYLTWGTQNNVPMYVGEFGLYQDCFMNNKGGLHWVNDMIDIFAAHGVHFTYHAYHESAFGIYQKDGALPDPATANTGLINLLTGKLP